MPDLTLLRRPVRRLPRFDAADDTRRLPILGVAMILSCGALSDRSANSPLHLDRGHTDVVGVEEHS